MNTGSKFFVMFAFMFSLGVIADILGFYDNSSYLYNSIISAIMFLFSGMSLMVYIIERVEGN